MVCWTASAGEVKANQSEHEPATVSVGDLAR